MKTVSFIVLVLMALASLTLSFPQNRFRQTPFSPILKREPTLSVCGDSSDILTVDSLSVSPDPPERGHSVVIQVQGNLSEEIPPGTKINVVVKWGLIQLLKQTMDFCEQAKQVDEQCPLAAGALDITKSVDLPQNIPAGQYFVDLTINLPDGREVTCIHVAVKF